MAKSAGNKNHDELRQVDKYIEVPDTKEFMFYRDKCPSGICDESTLATRPPELFHLSQQGLVHPMGLYLLSGLHSAIDCGY